MTDLKCEIITIEDWPKDIIMMIVPQDKRFGSYEKMIEWYASSKAVVLRRVDIEEQDKV